MDSIREVANKIHFDFMKVKENSIIVDEASNWFDYLELIKNKKIIIDKLKMIIDKSGSGYDFEGIHKEEFPQETIARALLDMIVSGDEHLINQYIDSI